MNALLTNRLSRAGMVRRHPQHGLSLFVVLIALVLLSLGAVGLIRMVDTSTLIAGNLAFKQSATLAADNATERAIAWLEANYAGGALDGDQLAAGYYASALDRLDISGNSVDPLRTLIDWNNDNCGYAASGSYAACRDPVPDNQAAGPGISAHILITRMCSTTGNPDAVGNNCSRPVASVISAPSGKGKVAYGSVGGAAVLVGPYFRIVVRAEGPRKTVSYTESYVYFQE